MLVELTKEQVAVINTGLDLLVRNQGINVIGQVLSALEALKSDKAGTVEDLRREIARLKMVNKVENS